ncbi:MAG: hypothetical protein Q9166_007337, partial [cf. Caloplaca sp. 2 TL-2023]
MVTAVYNPTDTSIMYPSAPLTDKAITALTNRLNNCLSKYHTSPILLLHDYISTLITSSPSQALAPYLIACLHEATSLPIPLIPRLPYTHIPSTYWLDHSPLTQHLLVTTTILDLAAPTIHIANVHAVQAQSPLGGLVSLAFVNSCDSLDLSSEFALAIDRATKSWGAHKTTVMGVQLIDKGVLEVIENEGVEKVGERGLMAFGISFAVAVGPEGACFWMAGRYGLK